MPVTTLTPAIVLHCVVVCQSLFPLHTMRALLGFDVHVAAAAKASLAGAATFLIWRYRGHRKILPLALLLTGVFAGVVLYQGLLMLAA